MKSDVNERIRALRERMSKNETPRSGRWSNLNERLKKVGIVGAALAAVAAVPLYYFTSDFLLKRQNFPERNVLYRSSNIIQIAGGSELKGPSDVDERSETVVYEGGTESKVGTYLFRVLRESKEDVDYFNMDNSEKIRIASATKKPEKVQAGLRLGGSFTFIEQLAEIILETARAGSTTKAPQSHTVYEFLPERGTREEQITVITNPDKTRTTHNKLTELRSMPLGWLFGIKFRAGTTLEEYVHTSENERLMRRFLADIKELNSPESRDPTFREHLIKRIVEFEDEIARRVVYASFEDGIIDWFPQESTIYLGRNPGFWERQKHNLGFGRHDGFRFRVENYWDLWPGRFPILSGIHFGSGDNVVYPFDKFNNGEYVLEDKFGEIAKIDIRDFILYYGQDTLYSYYLDLNGDGRIDESRELIGQVLFRTTHDERMDLENLVGRGKPKRDVTFTTHYSFMTPDSDMRRGLELFNLCGFLETFMPDQTNRGYGKHSMLGYINEQRSNIMLFNNLSVENMSRALTEETSLIAIYDIVNVLISARRPYARDVARMFGIEQDFDGQYQSSDLLKERVEIGPLPGTFAGIATGLGGLFYLKRRRRESREELLAKIKK